MKKERNNKKSNLKITISICAVFVYIFTVVTFYSFLKPQQYEESNIQKSKQIATQLTYNGLKDLNIKSMELTSTDKIIDYDTIAEKGLVYTNYQNINLKLVLDDFIVVFNEGTFSFEFFDLTKRERLVEDLGLSYKVKYEINMDNLEEKSSYSKVLYVFLIMFLYPFLLLFSLVCCFLVISLFVFLISSIIEKVINRKNKKREESSLNLKLTNSCANDFKKKK